LSPNAIYDQSFNFFALPFSYVLAWLPFWIFTTFLLYPLSYRLLTFLKLPGWKLYLQITVTAPLLLALVLNILGDPIPVNNFLFIPLGGGIAAGLVFRELVRLSGPEPTADPAHRLRWTRGRRMLATLTAVAVSMLFLAIGARMTAWWVAHTYKMEAAVSYRLDHPTWPRVCLPQYPSLAAGFVSFASTQPVCRKMAENGDAVAQFALADWARNNLPERNAWLAKAAEQGFGPAMTAYGTVLFSDNQGVPKDQAAALELLHRSADLGDPMARVYLSSAYRTGSGVPQDPTAELMWLEVACRSAALLPKDAIALKHTFESRAASLPADVQAGAHQQAEQYLAQQEQGRHS
jgi:hypothetical protein